MTARVRWADRKVLWLEQVARDRKVTDFGLRVALMIAIRSDASTGCTCASLTEFAALCAGTRGGIRKAVAALVVRRHLTRPTPGTRRRPAMYTMDVHALRHHDGARGRVRVEPADGVTGVYLTGRNGVTDVSPSESRSDGKMPSVDSLSQRYRISSTRRAALLEAETRDRRSRG